VAGAGEKTKTGEEPKLGEPKVVESGKPAGEDGPATRQGRGDRRWFCSHADDLCYGLVFDDVRDAVPLKS